MPRFYMGENPRDTLWRLNANALNNPQFVALMKEEIKQFVEINDTGEVDSLIVCDPLKEVNRGKIISYFYYYLFYWDSS